MKPFVARLLKRAAISGCIVSVMLATQIVAADDAEAEGGYALKDGDTVVFLGDSITAARTYGKIVEDYTLLRFPERRIRFINAGHGGDTATGGLERLQRDVFDRGATVLIVAYGVNDIGWGLRADDEHKQKYLDSIAGIVSESVKRGVRVYICSAAITAENPDTAEKGFLQQMCDEGLARTRELGGRTIDVQRGMREIQRRVITANQNLAENATETRLHVGDGVHLNDLGHLAMAFVILKGLGAPADVSSATLDAGSLEVVDAAGCTVSDLRGDREHLEFSRLDEGLPLNHGLFFALNFRFVPVHSELNQYLLSVRNLDAGRYEVVADGRPLGAWTAQQLEHGVNIASATSDGWQPGGPWNVQANMLQSITDARHELNVARVIGHAYLTDTRLPDRFAEQADQANAQMEELQRTVARPSPYRFVIRPAATPGE